MYAFLVVSLALCNSFTFEQIPSYGYATKQSRFSSLIYFNDSLYTFGGGDLRGYSNDLNYFNLVNETWTSINLSQDDAPSQRATAYGFVYSDEIYIYGGYADDSLKSDLWKFNATFKSWKKIECSGDIPEPRSKPAILALGSSVFLYGGDRDSGIDSRIFELDLKSFEWKILVDQGKIESRAGSALFWYNETLNIWGGSTYSINLTQIDLKTLEITEIFVSSTVAQTIIFFPFAVYSDALYIFQGYTYPYADYNLNCSLLNLTSLTLENFECPFDSLFNSYAQLDNKLYLFGSELYNNFTNELIQIDLADNLNLTILSPHNDYPPSRVDHTMFRCRNFLWVFGGRSNGKYYDDSWKFDVVSEKWELIDPSTNSPSARYGHKGIYLHGDAYIIFGGFDGFSYFNDIFLYNFVANSWSDISGSRDIPARVQPCLFIKYPYLYIHGGLSSIGVLSDLWKFNLASSLYEEIIAVGSAPALYNHICVDSTKDEVTSVFSGTSATGQSNPYLFAFNRLTLTWSLIDKSNLLALSNTRFLIMSNSSLLVIGGSRYYQAMDEILFYDFETVKILGTLPRSLVSYEIAQAGKNLYIYGGSFTIHKAFFPAKGTQNLYKLSIDQVNCSPGYYGDTCEICPMGSYSSEINSKTCELCEPGTYSDGLGLTSKSQCLPCPYGTFNDKYGKHQCYFCGNSDGCWLGTVNKKTKKYAETFETTQPKPYDKRESEVEYCIEITQICVIVSLCIVCAFYFFDRKLKFYYKFDIFMGRHPSGDGKIAKKTAFGGLFSLIFLIFSIFFILSPVFYYTISNVSETKTLVPGFTLENKDYKADYIFFSIKLYNMNNCVDPVTKKCSSLIYISPSGISTRIDKKNYFCRKIDDYCQITSLMEDTVFDQIGYINATIQSDAVFTTGIEVYIRISTSMPKNYNESSIKYLLEPPKNFVYNGIEPCSFYIGLIPTVFFCDESIGCKSNKTGYHITNLKNPENGSLSNSLNINSYNSFSLSIYFEKSQNSFVIEWRINTLFFVLISGILGSIAGLFGTIGWIMGFSEKKLEVIKRKLEKHKVFNKIKKKRKDFKNELANALDSSMDIASTDRPNEPESKRLAIV